VNTKIDPNQLFQQCHTRLPGNRMATPAEDFAAMAAWCEANGVEYDQYGEGKLVQDFEAKVAALLGFEAGLFVASGTMAQSVALRLASTGRGKPLVALHATAHVLKHERSNNQLLDHFKTLEVGNPNRPWTVADLKAWPDPIGAALYELPMREIGGQAPSWDELEAIKQYCREKDIHLHMDGARLWEVAACYGRSHAEIAAGFDSVYVSLYKGIGGLGGAMLLGKRTFIDEASMWVKRMGGDIVRRTPFVVSAAMQFDQRLAIMPALYERTLWLYDVLRDYPAITPNPACPQANMLHLHMPVSAARAIEIRNQIAAEHGIWLHRMATDAALPNTSYVEWYVGDSLLATPDETVRRALEVWSEALTK
jgi:threonine aldolase